LAEEAFQMMGIISMSLSSRKWLVATVAIVAATLGYAGSLKVSKASAMNYTCPAKLMLSEKTYPLEKANVFDGPIENRASLVPETDPAHPELAVWHVGGGQFIPHLKCRYLGTHHYLVLEAAGAKQCWLQTATNHPVSAHCQ
jgi:hypothetical protein